MTTMDNLKLICMQKCPKKEKSNTYKVTQNTSYEMGIPKNYKSNRNG
jgi:hypothetical protein